MRGSSKSSAAASVPSGRGRLEALAHQTSPDGRADGYFHSTFVVAVAAVNQVPSAAAGAACFVVANPRQQLHSNVARVFVSHGAATTDTTVAPRAARGVVLSRACHHEHRVGRRCCDNDKHQQLRPREGRADSPGVRAQSNVVPSERLDAVLVCPPPCLPVAARLHHPAWHKKCHARTHTRLASTPCFPASCDARALRP